MPGRPALIVHGGAGQAAGESELARREGCRRAAAAGWEVLARGGSALDAVTAAVAALEEDPLFNAGRGACRTAAGTVELDACLMEGTGLGAGAVGAVEGVASPVLLARAVLADGRHVLLAGPGALAFARNAGVPTCEPAALAGSGTRRGRGAEAGDTVGAVACDRAGRLAAATSTGGIPGKLPGRIGDSAVPGAGTYADDRLGAASATGSGEALLRATLARRAVELLAGGRDPEDAAARALAFLETRLNATAGLIVLDPFGRVGVAHTTPAMVTAHRRPGMSEVVTRQ